MNLPLSILVLDVDDFKAINDRHGHITGDSVLRALAGLCRSVLRRSDVLARYGGEEFVVLLPETTKDQAVNIAERIRQAAIEIRPAGLSGDAKLTLSLGVAGKSSASCEIYTLIDQADQAMLEAKRQGKNRVVVYRF